jgi:16S rRNA (uracil1498-N3)-methyltransferase
MADRYFTRSPLAPGEFLLEGPDAHHLAIVLRAQPGTLVTLFNGDGCEYPAVVQAVSKRQVALTIMSRNVVSRERPFPVVVAATIPKGDRADYLIEKLTEVGTTQFIPLISSRAVVVPKESKTGKWERAVIEASKQCGRNILMGIDPPTPFRQLLSHAELPPRKFILHTSGDRITTENGNRPVTSGAVFAVGPEGGWTTDEVSAAIAAGWHPLSLGPRILRVETAAVVAATWGC